MIEETVKLISQFLLSWYSVATFLGVVFIVSTREGWIKFIKNLRLSFRHKDINVSSGEVQGEQKGKIPKKELKEIESFLSRIGIKDSKEFNQFLKGILSDLSFKEQKVKETERTVGQYRELIINLWEAFEFYQFAYLNLYLVHNSKLALWWFYNKGAATKELFILSFPLPPSIVNQISEKEAIFNALLSNRLLESTGNGLYKVSIIGERFLKFIGFIQK